MATERQVADENYERFSYARDNGHLDFVEKATKCDRYFLGDQWDDQIRNRLERLGKPAITVNKVLSTCAAIFGEQLDNRVDVSFRPSHDGNAETAAALDKVWIHIAEANNLDWLESEVATDGFIRGRGFYDVRINFDDQLRGEVRIKQLNSKNVVLDPDAEEYDPDGWKEVFITKWLSIQDVERYYGKRYGKELRGRPVSSFTHRYDSVDWLPDNFGTKDRSFSHDLYDDEHRRLYRIIERQFREVHNVEVFVDPNTGDFREIPDTWERERIVWVMQNYGLAIIKRPIEKIRWTTTVDNVVLHNEISPMMHFTTVPYFPYFRHGQTIGVVENLIPVQDLLNKSISQELHIVNTTANSGWKMKNGALANMTPEELEERGAEDGLVIITNGSPNDIEKILPNQVPSGLDRLSFKADEALKEVSMVSDSMRGFDRADVAAKAIQAKQARGTVSLAKPFENLAYTRKLLARNVLDLVQAYYTEERVINITGRDLNAQTEQMTVNQQTPEGIVVNDLTVGEYHIRITTVPARDDFEQSQFQEAYDMRQLGIAIPDDVLVEHSHLTRKAEIADRIKQANGGAEPTEAEQQMRDLELQVKQLEAQELQADIQVKQSNAMLNQTRAQKEAGEAQQDGPNPEMVKVAMDREKMLTEMQIKREASQSDMQLKQQIAMEELRFKREQLQLELEMKRAEYQMKMEELRLKQQMAQEQAYLQRDIASTKADTERDLAYQKAAVQQDIAMKQSETNQAIAKEQAKANQAVAKSKSQQAKKGADK